MSNKTLILGASAVLALAGSSMSHSGRVLSQQRAPLAFEVATVRPNVSGTGGSSTNSTNGLLRITNQTLRSMIQYAFNVRDFQISGGPGWMSSDRFDVTAKPETGAHDQEMKQMLQTMLIDRFQLQFHRESQEGTVYALLVAKSGAKLRSAMQSDISGITSGRSPKTGLSTLKGERIARISEGRQVRAAIFGRFPGLGGVV